MAKKKCPDCPECLPAWLAAFGDLMSLLLCFFVLLLSMSSMDAKKVSEAIGSLSGAMSVLDGGTNNDLSEQQMQETRPTETKDGTSDAINKVSQAATDANEMIDKGNGPAIKVEEAQEGFVIELPASLLFKAGSAIIENEDALLFLKRVALIVQELPTDMHLSIEGHTDNLGPAKSSVFKDNWELSSARAISVLKELLLDGVEAKRTNASGFAQYNPIATNATKSGRAKNRRVELRFFGIKTDEKVKETILDKAVSNENGFLKNIAKAAADR